MAGSRKKTEREFLADQSEIAARGIKRSALDLVRHVRQAVNPVTWVKAHPIASMGAAVLGGFAATAATGGGHEAAPRSNGTHEPHGAEQHEQGERRAPSMKEELMKKAAQEAISAVRPILTGIVSAYLASNRAVHEHVEPETNAPKTPGN
ncbi:MAG TPA: hypothetical protein VMD30_02505 [Tepidisphaeraceae bacterium]|nr:hypothetical protein [Tepidisphaeraceae bacterium]